MSSLEEDLKYIVAIWSNIPGSHSDDLLEELKELLREHNNWEPTQYWGAYHERIDAVNEEFGR